MSTKTIAVDSKVYQKLSRIKGESESFSKLIDRLVGRIATAHTGADIIERLGDIQGHLSDGDYEAMKNIMKENRRLERWDRNDLS